MHARLVLDEHRPAANASLQVRRNAKQRNVRCCKPCQRSVTPNVIAGLARGAIWIGLYGGGQSRAEIGTKGGMNWIRRQDKPVCCKRAKMGQEGV